MSAAPLRRLGELPVSDFLARCWQRRALCVRQAIAGFSSPVSRAQLFALAGREDVESRLVTDFAGRWRLRHGPFARGAIPSPRRAGWTLLVQGADLHMAAVANLAMRFRFLPAARFDDVMVSYASDRGGVGPHVDQYDVFLLQAQGRRRWRIAATFDPQLIEGAPLRVLARFRHQQEWVLEPGDLLYLPPGVAHEGAALGECITISIGFRLPAWQEIAEAWTEHGARHAPLEGRLPDGTRLPTGAPGRLPETMVEAVVRGLRRAVPGRQGARRTLLEHLTEPKPTISFSAPRPRAGIEAFVQAARSKGLVLELRTRMLYAGPDFAVNGELQAAGKAAARLLRRLSNHRGLSSAELRSAGEARELFALLHAWYRFGWLHIAA